MRRYHRAGCPRPLHRFLGAYLRYETHVLAFLLLVANPFPGFTGTPGSYPVDLQIAPRERQNRLKTLFRGPLAIPAHLLAWGLTGALWGSRPSSAGSSASSWAACREGLRNLGAYCLRYLAQTYAYEYLLTDSYPFSGPDRIRPAAEDRRRRCPHGPAHCGRSSLSS